MKHTTLSAAIALSFALLAGSAVAQDASQAPPRSSVSTSSNTTNDTATKRSVQQLSAVQVKGTALTLGGGLMSVQEAPKAVSTITRDAIQQMSPGATFVQAIESIPGVVSATDDVTGLNDGDYSIRGFTGDEIGVTVNGAPINDSGNYKIYSSEYGDTENMGDITVLQGYPDNDMPMPGAAGGSIAWVTVNPSHEAGLDFSQSFGDHDYRRTFLRFNTGDTGPVRSWISWSDNRTDLWRGAGTSKITKVDAKSVWTIDDNDSITASVQYNREVKTNFESLTKAQVQQGGYDQGWSNVWVPGNAYKPSSANCGANVKYNYCFYGLHQNPFRNYLVSLDGEFRLSDNLRLSVVPYFQYGFGGGGSETTFSESTLGAARALYQVVGYDLNGNGKIDNSYGNVAVNSFSYSTTYRPGVIAKLNQDVTENNTLEYGVWYEKPRQQQGQVFGAIDPSTGFPGDYWAQNNLITYPNGAIQKSYDQYTQTTNAKGFITDTWTPTDQLTFTGSVAYLWSKRDGFVWEYPGSTGSVTSKMAVSSNKAAYGAQPSATFHDFTPTGGVKLQLNDQNQLYFGMGKTFRAPINGAVLSNALGNFGANPIPNKPETSVTADLGWRFYGDRLSASVDAYGSNFHNKQVSGYDENTGMTVYTMLPDVHMRGLNSEASFKLSDDWKLYGSYTYTQAKMEANLNSLGDGIYYTRGKTLIATPKNSAFLSLSFNHGPIWAALNAKYAGAQWGDWSNTQKVGGYTVFNFNAGVSFNDFASWLRKPYIKLNVYNLGDRKALVYAKNISAFLAANPNNIKDVNGTTLYASQPYYSVLEERTFMVTFGASFF